MADAIPVELDKDKIAAHNAEIIQKQAAQDISGGSTSPDLSLPSGGALDNLRNAAIAQKKAEAGDEGVAPAVPEVVPAAAPAAAPEAAAPAAAAPSVTPAADALAKAKADADAKLAEEKTRQLEETRKQADELFKGVASLPPNASPKSSEAFAAVKMKAAEEISKLQAKVEELAKVKQELEVKAATPLTDEVKKELETLREFRARLDVETDPKWKQFDNDIAKHNEFIYAQLGKANLPATVIEDIKKYGGPANVNMEKILAAVTDPTSKRIIEAKLADIEMIGYSKEQAISKAKEDVKKYQEERAKEWEASATQHNTATKASLDALTSKIAWLNKVPVEGDEAAKKAAEAHNTYAEAMRKELEVAAGDDSAEMRATLLIGMANLFRLQTAYDIESKAHTQLKESHKKEVDELTATVARLKAAGTNRLRTSTAPAGGAPAPTTPSLTESAGDALDRLRAQKMREQQ
jgi:hypothetical protein